MQKKLSLVCYVCENSTSTVKSYLVNYEGLFEKPEEYDYVALCLSCYKAVEEKIQRGSKRHLAHRKLKEEILLIKKSFPLNGAQQRQKYTRANSVSRGRSKLYDNTRLFDLLSNSKKRGKK